jgi:hypothetical protein
MLYPISVEGKWGFIDAIGKVVIEPRFLGVSKFYEGLAVVSVPGLTAEDQFFERKASGFIDERGEWVIGPGPPPGYELPETSSQYYSYGDFHDGLAKFWVGDATGQGGYVNRAGQLVIPPKYADANDFSEGLACVSLPRKDGSPFGPKRTGFIDHDDNFVIAAKRSFIAQRFSEGLCVIEVEHAGDWEPSVINRHGKTVIQPGVYSGISDFVGGLARVVADGRVGCIDPSGRIIIPIEFDQLWQFDQGPLTTGERNGKKFILDRTGRCVHEIRLGHDFDLSRMRGGFARVQANGKFGYVNSAGELTIPLQYDRAEDFCGELALVTVENLKGYINQRGEFVWQTDSGDEPIRNSVKRPLSDFLPPGTLESLPLEYNWDRVENAIVFATNAKFASLEPWFIKQFAKNFEVHASCDLPGTCSISFSGEEVHGSFHAVDAACENADGFMDFYSSSNMRLLKSKHEPTVVGILIQDR